MFASWKNAVRGGLHGIVANQVDDKVRQAIIDANLSPEDLKNPKSILTFAVALVACVPEAFRKPVLLALAGIIRTDARFVGLTAWAVPEILEGVDSGLDGATIDAAAMRTALFSKLDGSAKGTVLNATTIAEGAAFVSKADGGLIHRAGCTECGETHKGTDPFGKPEDMFTKYSHRAPCPICWDISADGRTVTVKGPATEPAKESLVDALIADVAGTGNATRALAVFSSIMEMRSLELINQPTGSWHLALMHRKGLPMTPKALKLLPVLTETPDEKATFDGHHQAIMAAHASGSVLPAASVTAVLAMVSRFNGYIEAIRLVAERDVNDVWEGAARFLDKIDDRITAETRARIVSAFHGGNVVWAAAVLLGAYVVVYGGTWLTAVAITLAVTSVAIGWFLAGAIPFLGSAYAIVVWPMPIFPMHLLFVGWCVVFVVCAITATFDGMFGKVKALLQGWIPGRNAGFGTWLASTAVHWARKFNLVPEAKEEAEGVQAPEPSESVRKMSLVVSIAASLIFLLANFLAMMSDVMKHGDNFGNHLGLFALVFVGLIAEWGRRFHYLYSWSDRISMNKKATSVIIGGFAMVVMLLICGGTFTALLGGSNLRFAHRGVQQEFGEMVGSCNPEHYPRGSQGYCDVFPNDVVCGGTLTQQQIRAEIERTQGQNPECLTRSAVR